MPIPITVTIPVGPSQANKKWLSQALDSVCQQTLRPEAIVLVLDQADLPSVPDEICGIPVVAYRTPWRVGVTTAFNFGVALAPTECVFMLGSDDYLEPTCLEECAKAYEDPYDYYWVPVHYLDGRENPDQYLPCNAAMVTKTFWEWTGGLPYEAFTAGDAALVGILLTYGDNAGLLHQVGTKPLYNYRPHPDTDTACRSKWQGVILETRRLVAEEWKPRRPAGWRVGLDRDTTFDV